MDTIVYTPDEIEYQKNTRKFFEHEVGTYVLPMDKKNEYPFELLKKLGANNYIGVRFPREWGGAGKDLVHETIVNEECGAQSIALACARSVPTYVAQCILKHGTNEQRQKYLKGICKGELIAAECLSEPDVGSDAVRVKSKAHREGDYYILTGEKRFTASGAVANVYLVYCNTNPAVHPSQAISALLVEKGTPNVHALEEFDVVGYRGLRIVSQLIFNNAKIPARQLLGTENDGLQMIVDMLDVERVIVAASFIGAARSSLEIAVKFSGERVAFHRRLREFEAISFSIADMVTKIEAGRLLRVRAARMIDNGIKATREAAMAKVFSTEAAFSVINDAMQIMGGIGYTTDYPLERHMRDARAGTFVGGSSEMMRLVIQRETYNELLGQ